MSKNLVDNESFEFTEGAEREQFEEIAGKVDYLWNEDLPRQFQSLRASVGGLATNLVQLANRVSNSEDNIVRLEAEFRYVDGQLTEVKGSVESLGGRVDAVESAIGTVDGHVTSLANFQNSSTLLFDDEAGVGQYINLSEDFRHFKYLLFVDSNYGSDTVIVGDEARNHTAGQTSRSIFVNGIVGLGIKCVDQFSGSTALFIDINRLIVQANSGTQLFVQKGSRVTIGGDAVSEVAAKPIWKVYGVQRIAANDA